MSKIFKLFMILALVSACSPKEKTDELTVVGANGSRTTYQVELAQTREELTTGLMNRTSLDKDAGMVFDLSDFNNVPTAMWMKDTQIGLDMIFIDQDGMIYWIYENAEPDSVKMIIAPYPAAAVLEVNAGDVKAKGIKIGDMVEYKLFPIEKPAAPAAVEQPKADEQEEVSVQDDNAAETIEAAESEVVAETNVVEESSDNEVTDEVTDEATEADVKENTSATEAVADQPNPAEEEKVEEEKAASLEESK